MITVNELKPILFGAVGGAVALAILGFTWGGWVTKGSAEAMAAKRGEAAMISALAPICASQFQLASDAATQQAEFAKKSTWDQTKLVEAGGWAKMPGSTEAQAGVAKACADMIVKLKL